MMLAMRSIWAILVILFSVRCSTKEDHIKALPVSAVFPKARGGNSVIGTWKYSNSVWYTSELILNENGSFVWHDQGCYGQGYSEGKWARNGGLVQLKSFEAFRGRSKAGKSAQSQGKRNSDSGSEANSTGRLAIQTRPAYHFPGPHDTIRYYLDQALLQLIGDTLYSVGTGKLPVPKFYRVGLEARYVKGEKVP